MMRKKRNSNAKRRKPREGDDARDVKNLLVEDSGFEKLKRGVALVVSVLVIASIMGYHIGNVLNAPDLSVELTCHVESVEYQPRWKTTHIRYENGFFVLSGNYSDQIVEGGKYFFDLKPIIRARYVVLELREVT
jgi:hypothetical protein